MAFKTFAPGVLTSSDLNTFLMRQAVITCTAATRPASPNEGMMIYETDTDALAVYTGTAWQYRGYYQTFTPTIAAASTGWSVGNGTATGEFTRIDDFVVGRASVVFGSTSTFGAADLDIDLPVNGANTSGQTLGIGMVSDNSTGTGFQFAVNRSSQTFRFNLINVAFTYGQTQTIINTRPMTWNGSDADSVNWTFFYEAA